MTWDYLIAGIGIAYSFFGDLGDGLLIETDLSFFDSIQSPHK